MKKPILKRLPLDSPIWDDQNVQIDGGARERLKEILALSVGERAELTLAYINATECTDCPCLAFHYASPYFVDSFECDFESNWIAFRAYSAWIIPVFNGVIGPCLDQIWGDRDRISKLMLKGIDYINTHDTELDIEYETRRFLGCIAAVYGDEILGRNIRDPICTDENAG